MSIMPDALLEEHISTASRLLIQENAQVLEKLELCSIRQLIRQIDSTQRVFLLGEGRSGLVAKMAAMRFMHLGYQVYVVGETTTPPIQDKDLLITCSGSGQTPSVCLLANQAKAAGAKLAAVTTNADSVLGQAADILIELSATGKQDSDRQKSDQFAGSLFEQSMLLLFDCIFHASTAVFQRETNELWRLHTNLE